jgi:hypothetical protein
MRTSRDGPGHSARSAPLLNVWIVSAYAENVGSQFLSLRQCARLQHSQRARRRSEKPNNGGLSCANLRTETGVPRHEIRFLRPTFSKPQDFVDLVRIS